METLIFALASARGNLEWEKCVLSLKSCPRMLNLEVLIR